MQDYNLPIPLQRQHLYQDISIVQVSELLNDLHQTTDAQ